ncbi:MAG: ankyrin repeat domain-containing protein [Blastocatellia bacterium]
MIQLAEMKETRPMEIHDGVVSTTTDVWNMLTASRDGDLDRVKDLAARCPALISCQYDYTAPLHLAVREGRLDLVRYLVEHGALDPNYKTHPFLEPLVMVAEDRGYDAIAQFLKESLDDPKLTHEWGDTGKIDHGKDETERRFQNLVDKSEYAEAEAQLKERPELARDELAFWGEGILMMPAKNRDRQMLELLMQYGARVPDLSKWGERYYFKHYDIAAFLMEHGMNPNHMNWHRTTLLHDKAYLGDIQKARLLLDHGAGINAVDEEFRSTPLGFAARWGQREMVALLLERGADPNISGAPWATPLAWARKKGRADVEADLRQAGAR